jgi:pyridoxal phosphate enzyme (YggS family)
MALSAIAENLEAVRARIEAACARAGRDPSEVTLVAVSKRHGEGAIREAYAAGQRVFGENYVQELAQKASALEDLPDLRLHFIGHLQRNKAKAVRRVAAAVETVDSLRLADALDHAEEGPGVLPVLIQVNVAREPQKAGCEPDALPELIAHVRSLPSLRLDGLMTVPPASDDPEAARPYFKALRDLAAEHALEALSMGMSADLEVAIEEGATLVRVGTAIFGAR